MRVLFNLPIWEVRRRQQGSLRIRTSVRGSCVDGTAARAAERILRGFARGRLLFEAGTQQGERHIDYSSVQVGWSLGLVWFARPI